MSKAHEPSILEKLGYEVQYPEHCCANCAFCIEAFRGANDKTCAYARSMKDCCFVDRISLSHDDIVSPHGICRNFVSATLMAKVAAWETKEEFELQTAIANLELAQELKLKLIEGYRGGIAKTATSKMLQYAEGIASQAPLLGTSLPPLYIPRSSILKNGKVNGLSMSHDFNRISTYISQNDAIMKAHPHKQYSFRYKQESTAYSIQRWEKFGSASEIIKQYCIDLPF